MNTIDLLNERDGLRRNGVDIIVKPTRCGYHSFNHRYTYEIYYRTPDGKMDGTGPSRPTGSWVGYYEALECAVNDAKRMLENAKE